MASKDNYGLLLATLQENCGHKTLIRNAHCVAHVTMAKPQLTASTLHTSMTALQVTQGL